MSPSGRGRGGRGGRSGRRYQRTNNNNNRNTKKKSLVDHNFYVGSAKQASDYEVTANFIINHIKKTYDNGIDIATALDTLTPFDTTQYKPTMQFSTQTDADAKAAEDKQFEIEHKARFAKYLKREEQYNTNCVKAYALIWERCAKGMQSRIEARTSFRSTILNNPIELLKAVKEHAQNYQEHRYEMSIILDSIRAAVNTKQRDKESLVDYTKRFRTACEVMESHIGAPITLKKYVQTMPGYTSGSAQADKDKRTAMIKEAHDQLLAFLYLENSDQAKYGSLLKGLATQQSLKHTHESSLLLFRRIYTIGQRIIYQLIILIILTTHSNRSFECTSRAVLPSSALIATTSFVPWKRILTMTM